MIINYYFNFILNFFVNYNMYSNDSGNSRREQDDSLPPPMTRQDVVPSRHEYRRDPTRGQDAVPLAGQDQVFGDLGPPPPPGPLARQDAVPLGFQMTDDERNIRNGRIAREEIETIEAIRRRLEINPEYDTDPDPYVPPIQPERTDNHNTNKYLKYKNKYLKLKMQNI